MWSICRGVELEGECVAAGAPGVCTKPAVPGSAYAFAVICRRESKLKLKVCFYPNYHWVIKRTCAWLKGKKKKKWPFNLHFIFILSTICRSFTQGSQYLMSVPQLEHRAFIKTIIKITEHSKALQSVEFPSDKFCSGVSSLTTSVYWLFLPRPAVLPEEEPSPVKHTLILQYSCSSWLLWHVVGFEEPCLWLLLRKSFLWLQWELRRPSAFVHLYIFYVLRETQFNIWLVAQTEWHGRGSSKNMSNMVISGNPQKRFNLREILEPGKPEPLKRWCRQANKEDAG